ncbi:MAG: PAS domain S-box protein, partial [Chloroflexi bacterium]|nr:PAS domain S-box protein [Chloroflexota bacterium]
MTDNRHKRLPIRKEAQQRPKNPEREQQLWEALQESENRYQLLFDDSPALYVLIDTEGMVQNANKAMLNSLGYSKDDVVGRHALEFVVPEYVKSTAAELAKALGNEKASKVEVDMHAKDGSVRTLLFPPNMAPLRNARGQTVAIIMAGIDITERKQVEKTLQQSEKRYRTLFQQSHDPVYIVSRDGALLDVNQAMCQLFNYSREEMLGMDIRKLYVNPDERTKLQQAIEKEGAVKDYEIRFRRKDGKEMECLITSTVRLNSDGSIAGYQGTMRDITERKQIETALRTSEETFRSLVQGANIGIATSDTSGVLTFGNPALYRIHGYTEKDLLDKPILNFIHPDDRERVLDFFRRLMRDHKDVLHTEFRTLHKDGHTIHLHVSPTHIRNDDQTTGFIASMIDITERKQMEEVLRQSEERYRTILDEMEDNYYEVDLAGNFTFVNEATCRTLGYSREELLGMNNRAYVAEEDLEAMYQDFNKVYLTGKPTRDLSYKIVRRDSASGIGELSVYPLRNEKGEIIGFRGIGRDITERKQMEKATREAEERYRALFDRSIEAVYIHDFEGNFVDANQVALDLLGYTGEDIPSLNFASLLDEEQILLAMQTLEELRETGRQQAINEFKLRRKDGKYVYVETEASVIHREEKPMVIQGIAR